LCELKVFFCWPLGGVVPSSGFPLEKFPRAIGVALERVAHFILRSLCFAFGKKDCSLVKIRPENFYNFILRNP